MPLTYKEAESPGRGAVAVLSHAFWTTEFNADPAALGRTVQVDGTAFTIVGVLPEEFTGADQWINGDFYVPATIWPRLAAGSGNPLENREQRTMDVKGRLREDVTLEQAQAEAAVLAQALAAEFPSTNRNYSIELRTELQKRLQEGSVTAPILAMLMLLAATVLLVACANVAGLLAGRAPVRAREMSIRLAIGAGRARLIRQLLTESVILALLGGIGGVAVGYAGIVFLRQMTIVADVPARFSFRLDERALLFSLAVAMVSVFLFGLWPARRTARADLADTLRAGGSPSSSAAGRPRQWTRNILVAGQIALSIVLLTVAAIMYVTLQRDLLAGPGFRTGRLLLARFDPNLSGYSAAQADNFYRDLPDRARALPGVRSVALASGLPGGYDLETLSVIPENYQFPEGQSSADFIATRANEDYFATMDVTVTRGRAFTAADNADSVPIAVINEIAAERYWPGQNPIGQRLRLGDAGPWREIVGVVRNMKFFFLVERPRPAVYVPRAQSPASRMTLILESAGDPAALAAPLREFVRAYDANLPAYDIRTMQASWHTNAVQPSLLVIQMIAAMGAMGVLLSLTGLYGLMAYSVTARRREIGIRMAVGAARSSVLGMVLREGLLLAAAGTALGLLLGLGAGRLMLAVFPTHVPSAAVYLMVVPAVFAVTMLAAFFPARRASQVDPASALRGD